MAAHRRIVGVSLKMYMGLARTRGWMQALRDMVSVHGLPDDVDLFVIPTFLSLADAKTLLAATSVAIGAQDVFWENEGAFTGEVSPTHLVEAGCRYVEIGHAERRRLFGETDEIVGRKVTAAVGAGLVPVLCIGETGRDGVDAAISECARQFRAATANIGNDAALVVAWEPIWAIGAAEPAGADYIIAVASGLRALLADWPSASLIYGGSAGPGLMTALGDAVDGLFLGRFAHDVSALRVVLEEAGQSAPANSAA